MEEEEEEEEKGVGRIEKTTTAMNEMDNRTRGVKKSRGKQERPTHRSVPTLSPPLISIKWAPLRSVLGGNGHGSESNGVRALYAPP